MLTRFKKEVISSACFDRLRGKRPGDETMDLFEWAPK